MKLTQATCAHLYDQRTPYAVSMEESILAIHKSGFKYIDASVNSMARREDQPLCRDDWEQWAYSIRELGEKLGKEFIQAHAFFPTGDARTGVLDDHSSEMLKRTILSASILGVEYIVIHPLTFPEIGLEEAFHLNCEYLSRWGEFCINHNIGMAIENMYPHKNEATFGTTPEVLLEIVNRINDPRVGICLDTGHANLTKLDIPETIRKIGPHLKATHISDNKGIKDDHTVPFAGKIDWPPVIKDSKKLITNWVYF